MVFQVGRVTFQWAVDRSLLGVRDASSYHEMIIDSVVDTRALLAEFVAMTLFVIMGCGTACANGAFDGATRLIVAFAFGLGILVLAYSIGHHSGGHINCAVTLSLFLGGKVSLFQAIFNFLAQMLGSISGAVILMGIFPCEDDMTTNLGSNIANPGYAWHQVLFAEAIGTFLLCFVVFETAVSTHASCGSNAVVAIGFAVFLAHVFLLPIDGCSINPTRSFGPAVVSHLRGCPNYTEGGLRDLWIFWVGPIIGAMLAALWQYPFSPECYEKIIASNKKIYMTPAGACVCCDNVPDQFLKHNPYQALREQGGNSSHGTTEEPDHFAPPPTAFGQGLKSRAGASGNAYKCFKPACFGCEA
ncbi:unnamed protein product [Polarella glacialis]|uniref:Aquaporin n=1 Tax=Polarella glacialis TaxID=89957 RepID=A0A813KAG4_POLGL|nr:unnamed protein product [Polarella glacialis]